MNRLKNIFTGIKKFARRWFTDTPGDFVSKPLSKGIDAIPRGAIIIFRSNTRIGAAIRIGERIAGGGEPWPNHAAPYAGQGKKYAHETIEAEPQGVVLDCLENSIGPEHQFVVFYNPKLTEEQKDRFLSYAYLTVGRPYDYAGDAAFLLPWIHQDPEHNFCSEGTTESAWGGGFRISFKPAGKTSPSDIMDYMFSQEGKAAGWIVFDTFNVDLPLDR